MNDMMGVPLAPGDKVLFIHGHKFRGGCEADKCFVVRRTGRALVVIKHVDYGDLTLSVPEKTLLKYDWE